MRPNFLNQKSVSTGTLMLFLAFMVFIGPFLSIWALNVLFPVLAIPYTWKTWIAMVILHLLIKGNVQKNA